MNEQVVAEVLAAHADQLVQGDAREEEYLALFPEYQTELAPLLKLARQAKGTLALVQPSEAFRNRLRQELLTSASKESAVSLSAKRPPWRQAWVIGAAAAGSVISVASAVGVIAHRRRSKTTKPAAAATG